MVVKRWLQALQKRRRRMAYPSSVGRLSFTWVSSWPQNGQCTASGSYRAPA